MGIDALYRRLITRCIRGDHILRKLVVPRDRSILWLGLRAETHYFIAQRCPACKAELPCECMLHIAQARYGRSVGVGSFKACTRFCLIRTQRLQPALAFLLQIFEGGMRR